MTEARNWQKSSFSNPSQECIEVAHSGGCIAMRESDDPGVVMTTTRAKLRAFIRGVKAGEFDHLVDK
jgi:hypothetical protein